MASIQILSQDDMMMSVCSRQNFRVNIPGYSDFSLMQWKEAVTKYLKKKGTKERKDERKGRRKGGREEIEEGREKGAKEDVMGIKLHI